LLGSTPILDGALLFRATTDIPQSGLSAADLVSVNRVSVLTRSNNNIQTGLSNEFSLANAIYVDGVSPSSPPLTFSSDFEYLKLSSVTPNNLQTTVGGFDLQWGLWTGSSGQLLNNTLYRNGLGDRVFENINDSAILISANITDVSSLTGERQFDSISNHLISVSGFENNSLGPIAGFFTVDFGTGEVTGGRVDFCIGGSSCAVSGFGNDFWRVSFGGGLVSSSITSRNVTPFDAGNGQTLAIISNSVGYFVGDQAEGFVLSFSSGRGVGADSSSAITNGVTNPDRSVNGAVLFGGSAEATTILAGAAVDLSGPTTDTFLLPDFTVVSQSIAWGAWDNPISENWVVVKQGDENLSTLSTQDYIATVNPTPFANMQGSANYGSGAASSFIGSGNAGDLSQVVAGMGVDFDTGAISDGKLMVEVGGSQVWNLDFEGSINGGAVELDMTAGQLSDFSGVISNSIEADLGGVFAGNNAEAFVGGFGLLDQINAVNQVNGIYTIER
jgi:hypothetical protein